MGQMYLVTASEMREYDNNTIEKIGIPACVLMERAALAAVHKIETYCGGSRTGKSVLIMAGVGNNGGDGLAVGRILTERGYEVELWCVGNLEKASGQWEQQKKILDHYPVEWTEKPKKRSYDVLVDALFGVGLSRKVEGHYAEAVNLFGALDGWKLALDVPSGIDSDTGQICGCAVQADQTVTFGFCKRGLVLYPGCEYAGEVETADIGIPEQSFFGRKPEMYAYTGAVPELLPKRKKDGNKGTFGKVLLVAGSENMAGAAVLAAKAAYRMGAGMVRVITHSRNRIILQEAVPEALYGTLAHLKEGLEWADVIAIGPGLGTGTAAVCSLEQVLMESGKPLLIDADGLNLLAQQPSLREMLAAQGKKGRNVILTPHVGELSRLTGGSIADCRQNLAFFGMGLAAELHGVVAAKDARTMVCQEGHPVCVNVSGNHGMATAGSGDVLSGIIAALLAQGLHAFHAASLGVYLHGMAADAVTEKTGAYSCMAGDIAEEVGICCNNMVTVQPWGNDCTICQ